MGTVNDHLSRGSAAEEAARARQSAEQLRQAAAGLDAQAAELEKGLIPRDFFDRAVEVLAQHYEEHYGATSALAREAASLHMAGRSCEAFEDLARKAPENATE